MELIHLFHNQLYTCRIDNLFASVCFLILLTMVLIYFIDEFDAYIIVSFVNATLVLSIGETVEEVTDSGFLGTTPTLGCSSLGDNALLQVKTCFFSLM